jgi:MoxR-like ATPase
MKEHPIKSVRRAGVPLVAFETSDPKLTIETIMKAVTEKNKNLPLLSWDLINGLSGINNTGKVASDSIAPDGPAMTLNPAECLNLLAQKAVEGMVVFMHNAQKIIKNEAVIQGMWNLRDIFKANRCTLVLLCPSISLPEELKNDCVIISENLPSLEEIEAIIDQICKDAEIPVPANKTKISDALLGLSAFAAEQVLAMSITVEGIDVTGLWERKRKMIEQTPGLSVWRGTEKFSDVGGCDNVKAFLKQILNGRKAPRAIAFIDEIEKCLAGASGDMSGVSQDYLSTLLTYMQDKQCAGLIFIGPPGAAKSAMAKAAGNEAGIPTISVDLGGMKGSLVGESEQRLRDALKIIDAVSQNQTLFIATCNSFGTLPPELKRRFTLGTFFFDLPSKEERDSIWKIYEKKYDIEPNTKRPTDTGWTGAEIKQCCDISWRLNRDLEYASSFIVPVSVSAKETIDTLRKQANKKFISASNTGLYEYGYTEEAPKVNSTRKFNNN